MFFFFRFVSVRRVLLQITEIHGVFDDNGTRVVVRVYVTNLGLKTAEFYVGVSDRNPRRDGDEKRTAHPQQTVECHLELECLANDCTAISKCFPLRTRFCPDEKHQTLSCLCYFFRLFFLCPLPPQPLVDAIPISILYHM